MSCCSRRSHFKCGRKSGCPARKQVQQSDADPSKLEITYFDAHTCDNPPPSSSQVVPDPRIISSGTQRNTVQLVPVAAVPSAQRYVARPSPLPHPVADMMPRTTGVLLPVIAVAPAALSEQAELLFIPSPACSQSELLPTEVARLNRTVHRVRMHDGGT
ncbi:hypothetical protein SETIT_2G126100v2 [Setaria italica]|uniref:WRKY domain-containing protein n=1 Tax=Setaria italica TaxID=4555 RepID=A0A368PXZ0_SETIT|nr:hypothetical protein SETIT_2G126100v2 [Setaria italica]